MGKFIASDAVIEDTTVPMISGVKGGNILLGDVVTDKPIVQALDYLRALDDDTFKQIAEINIGDPDNMLAYTVSGIQIRLGDGEDLKSKADLTASMLKDLPKSQGNVQYIDVNPSSPFIKTDKVTVQPKSNKSKSDTSNLRKRYIKQSAKCIKIKTRLVISTKRVDDVVKHERWAIGLVSFVLGFNGNHSIQDDTR